MKNHILLFIVLSTASNFVVRSQALYDKGYFIDTLGVKTECLIENKDWESSPREISYKTTDNSKPIKIHIDSISLFEIYGYNKYICQSVQIDRSSEDISNLSAEKKPIWQTEKLALKVLSEGKASLFMYRSHDLTRFFFQVNDSVISQLVCKSYQVTNANGTVSIATNNNFRQQLFVDVNNPKYKYDLSKLNYEEKELRTYFEQYNAKFEAKNTMPKAEKIKRDFFKSAIMVGINHSGLNILNLNDDRYNKKFEPAISPTAGAEFEFTLPFFNNKWSFIVQPVYNSKIFVKTLSESHPQNGQQTNSEFSYQGIDIPLGVRYRYSVNNNLKINATAYITNGILSWSYASIRVYYMDFDVSTVGAQSYSIGIGADYKKLGMELKYTGGQNFLKKYMSWVANFNVFSLGFKYRLVDLKVNR